MKMLFLKTGKEIKIAIQKRREQLQQDLDRYNIVLTDFMKDPRRVRAYLVRSSRFYVADAKPSEYTLFPKTDMSSEERQYIDQLCQRIFATEQELQRLVLTVIHVDDTQVFELTFPELIEYGFEPGTATE